MTTPANPPADLVAFIRAQLDEDEQVARYAGGTGRWAVGDCVDDPADHLRTEWQVLEDRYPVARVRGNTRVNHIARHDPVRVLAEVDAKRRILDLWELHNDAKFPDWDGGYQSALEDVLGLLALPFAGRPGFREEWKP